MVTEETKLKNDNIKKLKPTLKPHCFQHIFAYMAISSGVDIKNLSSMRGHFRVGVTLDTYTYLANDK